MGPLDLPNIFTACLFLLLYWLERLKSHAYHLASFLRPGQIEAVEFVLNTAFPTATTFT